MGMSQNMAELYAEMARAFNEGKIQSREGRRPENTTPTRFEDFAEVLARAYAAAELTRSLGGSCLPLADLTDSPPRNTRKYTEFFEGYWSAADAVPAPTQ